MNSLFKAVKADLDLLKEAEFPVDLTSDFQGFTFEGVEQEQKKLSFTFKKGDETLHILASSYIL